MSEPLDLDQLQQLYQDATHGPWEYNDGSNHGAGSVFTLHEDGCGGGVAIPEDDYPRGINNPAENIQLIAAMHSALPVLIATARAAHRIASQDRRDGSMYLGDAWRALDELLAQFSDLDAVPADG
jgi:hypothetical protein